MANSLKISGDSETGNEEQHSSHLQLCGKLGLSARNSSWNSGVWNAEGMWSNLACGKSREAFCGQGESGPVAWADGLERMLLC